jgi:penicillin amidase
VKKWILIILSVLVGLILVVGGGGYLWFHQTLKKALPQTLGEVHLPGLTESVQIIRDTFGVPHIYAGNESNLYFALGYALAQDRFWQMEFYRRLGHGRLSEIFGEDFIEVDRYFRMIGAAGLDRELPDNLTPLFESFANGINAYLETHQDRLPLEFKLLCYKPEPWQLDDYLAILKVVNWGLSSGWEADLTAAKMLEKAGEEKLREAFPVWPDDGPLIIPEQTKSLSALISAGHETMHLVKSLTAFSGPAASNNWVVSGKKSITGRPILANDTHLALSNPSLWWEVHIVCPTINVSGFVLLGIPGIPVGHNLQVAWGVTNVMVDDVDFFIEEINPENPRQYWYKDHWEDMKIREEIMQVKGQEPVKTEILLTRHGPIVNDVKQGSQEQAISARWAFTEGLQSAQAAYLLAKAKDVGDVMEALRYWELPSQNFVFADTNGNIGYWCCATIPIRSKGDGLLPVPGWTGEYEWKGYVPFEERPHLLNPEQGFIATANSKIIGGGYPHVIGHYWEPMDRIARIRQLLEAKEKISVDDVKRIHQDIYCVLASEITPHMIEVLEQRFSDENAKKAKDILSGWYFMMDEDSVGACLFAVTLRKMMENIFRDELGEDLFEKYIKMVSFPPRAIRMMVRKGSSPWFDNVNTPEKETMEDIIASSLSQTLSELTEVIGDDMDTWTWGRIHTLTFEHALAKKKPLDWIFNLGPFPVGGDNLTVNKKQYPYEKPYRVNHGVSQRMIVDLSNMDGALHVLPTGESGHLKSPHHRDQIDLYFSGEYHPAWTNRADVEKNSEGILILRPETE